MDGGGCSSARPYPVHFCSSVVTEKQRRAAEGEADDAVVKHKDVENNDDQGFHDWVEAAAAAPTAESPLDDCFDWEQGHIKPHSIRGQVRTTHSGGSRV